MKRAGGQLLKGRWSAVEWQAVSSLKGRWSVLKGRWSAFERVGGQIGRGGKPSVKRRRSSVEG